MTKQERDRLNQKVVKIVQDSMVYVDQGMGHGHFKLQVKDDVMPKLVDHLKKLFPKGRRRWMSSGSGCPRRTESICHRDPMTETPNTVLTGLTMASCMAAKLGSGESHASIVSSNVNAQEPSWFNEPWDLTRLIETREALTVALSMVFTTFWRGEGSLMTSSSLGGRR